MKPLVPAILLLSAALLTLGGCARRPLVQVEQLPEEADREATEQAYPPQCEEIPLPVYPDVEPRDRPELVTVRVDFTIDTLGRIQDLEASTIKGPAGASPFVETSLAAARTFKCRPALRLTRPYPDSDGVAMRPIPYRSSLIFHFHRDEKQVHATSG
jgi:hypothetical protein